MKWYNSMRGFASSARIREADIFVHATVLERSGIMGLAEGQRVAVDVADGLKGRFLLSPWCDLGDGSE